MVTLDMQADRISGRTNGNCFCLTLLKFLVNWLGMKSLFKYHRFLLRRFFIVYKSYSLIIASAADVLQTISFRYALKKLSRSNGANLQCKSVKKKTAGPYNRLLGKGQFCLDAISGIVGSNGF